MVPGRSTTMRAYQLLEWQRAGFGEAPVAEPGPGQVRVRIGGAGGGAARVAWETLPRDCELFWPQGGNHPELHEVVSLCQQLPIQHRVERFRFAETPAAYERLRAGDLPGRAVVLPSE